MSSNIKKRGEARAEIVSGAIQEAVGQLIGDRKMEAEGEAHQLVGHAKDEVARLAGRTQGAVEEVIGTAKGKVGELTGDGKLRVEGKVEELKGKVRQATSK